jgi:phage gp46-like protein
MRFEYAHYKKGGNMDLKTATLASLVHKIQDGFTTLLAQIKDGVWWTDSQRESVNSLLNMLRRLGGCNRPDVLWSTDVPCGRQYVSRRQRTY